MKLWIDDVRTPPDASWQWVKTSGEALDALRNIYRGVSGLHPGVLHSEGYEVISFDHDLGGDDTSRSVMMWLCEFDIWPSEIDIHTMNSVGREWLLGMANRYAPSGTEIYTIALGR